MPPARYSILYIAALATASFAVRSFAANSETVQFNYRLPQVGDRTSNIAKYDFDLNLVLEKGGHEASAKRQRKNRTVQRNIAVMEVVGDRATQVQVTYAKAGEDSQTDENPVEPRTLPIEGKSYIVQRRAIAFPLTVVGDRGEAVSDVERVLVSGNMDSVGHRNQLGRFLHGKSIVIGESLQLPKEMAAELLGMREANGDAQRLDLKLTSIHQDSGRQIADFATVLVVKMGSNTLLNLTGKLQIDVDTCRVLAADFAGTVNSREGQSDHGEVVDVVTDGTLKVAIQAESVR